MTLMGTFTQWEWKAAREKEQQVEAGWSGLARVLWLAAQAGQSVKKPRPATPVLKRLVNALGYAGK